MAINSIIISGNLGKDAVVRVTPNGKHIATFSIPAKSGFGDNEKTAWLQCKMFGAMAEKLSGYLHKGSKVTVSGEFTIEEWTKDSGEKVQTPTILVRDIDLPPRQSNQEPQQSREKSTPQSKQVTQQEPPMDFDDDIPF